MTATPKTAMRCRCAAHSSCFRACASRRATTLKKFFPQDDSYIYDGAAQTRDTNEMTLRTLTVRGGWLCDEVGMGKTCVCVALILANPCTDASTKADIFAFVRLTNKSQFHVRPMLP